MKKRSTQGKTLAVLRWPLWKAVPLSFLAYAIFSSLLLIIPPYFSSSGWIAAALIVLAGVIAVNWGRFGSPRFSEIAASFVFTVQWLVISIRAWAVILPPNWLWVVSLIVTFALAWGLPLINPRLSNWLWQEQMDPQTKIGRRALAIGLALAPAAGTLGASIGLFAPSFGEEKTAFAIMAALATFVMVVWSHSTSHQLFAERPG